jgi:subtilisin family serine protease
MNFRVDKGRLIARLARAGVAGEPVLTDRVRARLAALHLEVEGDTSASNERRSTPAINHGSSHIWLRALRKLRSMPTTAAVARAIGRPLAWTAPVHMLPGVKGLDACFCARPDVLLLRPHAGADAELARVAKSHRLRENTEKSRYLGGWRYFEIPKRATRGKRDALSLRAVIERGSTNLDVELEYVPLLSPFQFVPNDPMFAGAWNMLIVGAPQAWDLTRGDRGTVIAVIDSGCDLDHVDLRDSFISRGINSGDPRLDASPVLFAISGTADWHGTGVTGVLAATIDNMIGLAGLAGGCGILPVAVPDGSTVEFAVAIRYAAMNGARVINMSMSIGSYWFELSTRAAIDDAIAAGCVVCASAGNFDAATLVYPAHYPPVMAAGGSQHDENRWRMPAYGFGSHYGDELYGGVPTGVSVVAPAEDIETTDITGTAGGSPGTSPFGDYVHRGPAGSGIEAFFNATSASAPHISAAAGLVRSLYPTLSSVEVRRIIERTAEKTGTYVYTDVAGYPNGSRHPEMGYGRLNAFRALDLGDMMIRDWPGDDGIEPSTPPGGDFYTTSDIVIRPADDGIFVPENPSLSSVLTRGSDHTVSVRVRNAGPARARAVQVAVCATPFVGLDFMYPVDWTANDALHVRPTVVDPLPFDLIAGATQIVRFTFSAAQIDDLAGWTGSAWHPCLLGMVTSANDYAFADAPTGASLQMPRNNLAQRNLSVAPMEPAHFPIVVGHPDNGDGHLKLIVDAGVLAKTGGVYLLLDDARAAFPAADRAGAFAEGRVKVGRVNGGKLTKIDGARAVRIESPRAVVELIVPKAGRYALELAVSPPAKVRKGEKFLVRVAQRSPSRGVTGGATLMLGPF